MEKKTLSELVVLHSLIEQELIESGGEICPSLELAQLDLTERLEEKVEGYSKVIDRIGHSAEYYKAQADEYGKIAKGLTRGAQFLKDNLKAAMETLEKPEIVSGSVKAKLVKCPQRLVIAEEGLIPSEYIELVPKVMPGALKADLEAGMDVPGARLEGGTALRFYPNREVK